MEYRKLGNTDISVSSLCLGTMTWGEQNTESEAHEQLDFAFDQGINFIDTAEMYPVPPMAQTYTKTEQIIGNWDKLQKQRDKIILATKIAGPSQMMTYIRGGSRFNREHIIKAVDDSLSRLKTDYIDLYQLHWPDRNTNCFGQLNYIHNEKEEFTPILETLEVLNEVAKSGKVRHFGLSNETPWGTMSFLEIAKSHNYPRMMSVQNPYSLLNRTYEIGMAEVSLREKIGLLAYSPMGFGVLSGKYLDGKKPEGARITKWDRFSRYTNEQAIQATQAYVDLARKFDISPAQMALNYVTTRNFVTSNIIGATKMDQLKENIESVNLKISPELVTEIDRIHTRFPNPSP